ncbi:MAG: chaperone, heat shock protein 70, partial [Parcubacteria group bacterium Gr01-1014_70]
KKEVIEAKNSLDSLIYTAEKSLKDAGDKVPPDVRSDVQAKIDDAKNTKESEDTERMRSTGEVLSASMSKIGEAMRNATPPPEKKDDTVTDAEYREDSAGDKPNA